MHQLNPTDPFQSQAAYMYTHTHTHNLIVLSRTHSGLPIFHIVKKGKKKKKKETLCRSQGWGYEGWRKPVGGGGGHACWWTWVCAREGALKEECSFYRDANLEKFTGIILGLSHWDAHKTVLWDGSLPAVPCGSFGTEVSGREQPSAQGFQKNHCFH